MEIDRKLNLVLTLDKEVGREKDPETGEEKKVFKPYAYVHHTPILKAVYDSHFWILTQAVHKLYSARMTPAIASRVAMGVLMQVAKENGAEKSITEGLLPEIWRNTMVMMQTENGYEQIPLHEAERSMPADDVREVRNYVSFFTAASWFHWRQEREDGLYPAMIDSGAQIVSLTSTEYLDSLRTSMPLESSGAKDPPSSIAY